MLGEAEQTRAEQAHLVGRLRGGVDGEFSGFGRPVDDQGASLHWRRCTRLLVDRLANHVCRRRELLGEGRRRSGSDLTDHVRAVVWVDQRICGLGRHVVDDG